jgi:hypothetical protein
MVIQLFRAATLVKPTCFASEDWCEIPFKLKQKTAWDKILDILLWMPKCLALRTRIKALRDSDPVACEAVCQELASELGNPISRLARWKSLYGQDILGEYDYNISVNANDPDTGSIPKTRIFSDPQRATTTAFYDVANIWIQQLTQIATGTPTDHIIKQHAASALAAVDFHQSLGFASGGTFSLIFVLKVLCLVTPCEIQRQEARSALLTWGERRGLGGVCSSGAPLYLERRQ